MDTLLPPIGTAAAITSSALLVAATDTNASVELPVRRTVERSTVVMVDATDLVSGPVAQMRATCLLQKLSVTRVKADTAGLHTTALAARAASIAASSDPVVVLTRWFQVPIAAAKLKISRILGTRRATVIRTITLDKSGTHRNAHMHTVDYFNVIEINV